MKRKWVKLVRFGMKNGEVVGFTPRGKTVFPQGFEPKVGQVWYVEWEEGSEFVSPIKILYDVNVWSATRVVNELINMGKRVKLVDGRELTYDELNANPNQVFELVEVGFEVAVLRPIPVSS